MNDWRVVWAAIDAERAERGWTKRELYDRTGVSSTAFDAMRRDGQPLTRDDKIAGLLRGLGWLPGSIEAILAGGRPILDPNAYNSGEPALPGDRLDAIDDKLNRLTDVVSELLEMTRQGTASVAAAQRALDDRVRRLEDRDRTPGRGAPSP